MKKWIVLLLAVTSSFAISCGGEKSTDSIASSIKSAANKPYDGPEYITRDQIPEGTYKLAVITRTISDRNKDGKVVRAVIDHLPKYPGGLTSYDQVSITKTKKEDRSTLRNRFRIKMPLKIISTEKGTKTKKTRNYSHIIGKNGKIYWNTIKYKNAQNLFRIFNHKYEKRGDGNRPFYQTSHYGYDSITGRILFSTAMNDLGITIIMVKGDRTETLHFLFDQVKKKKKKAKKKKSKGVVVEVHY